MNDAVVDLIDQNLGSMPHPDGNPTQSVLGMTKTLRPEMAEGVRKAARRFSTSIVHLIETSGYSIVPNGDLAALTNRATETDPAKPVRVQCNTCGGLLFELNLTEPTIAMVTGSVLRNHFRAEPTDGCSCT